MRISLTLTMSLIFAVCGCGRRDYSIQFPETWEVEESRPMAMGGDICGVSPREESGDVFRENVSVVLESIPKSMSEKEYIEANLRALNRAFELPSGAQFAKTTVGSTDAYHLRYSFQLGRHELDNDVYIVVDEGTAYTLTCSHAKGKRAAFKAQMDSIIASFKLN